MKKIVLFVAASTVMVALSSCGGSGSQADKTATDSTAVSDAGTFGAKLDETGAISMDSLLAMVAAGQTDIAAVKVQGKVSEVCQAKGCWMNIDKGDGSGMRVTFKDYAFFVPKDCGGKTAIFQGHAFMDTTEVEDLRHYAEDEGKSKEEIAKITEPLVELAFEAEGVIIK